MRIVRPKTYDIPNPREKTWREDLYRIFNRRISFGSNVNSEDQNIDGQMVEIADTGLANTTVTINHNLKRIPRFIDFKYKDRTGDWYDSGTSWTTKSVFIKFTVANMKVRLFIH